MSSIGSLGQSQIIQFVLFFLVGMTLFIGVGNFFRMQAESMQAEISGSAFELIGNYFASAAVAAVDACKQCGTVESNLRIGDSVFGYYLQISLGQDGLTVATAPPTKSFKTSVNNLNASVNFATGFAPSIQPINLTYDRNQNTLFVGPAGAVSPTITTTTTSPPLQVYYGFNTHMYASGISNLDLTTFKQNVDDIASKNLGWIRFNIIDWEVAPSGASINWNYVNLAKYDEAINYAKGKGLKIFLVTNVPSWAKDYSLEKYKTITQEYYSFLANRYKNKIDIWQIFNEANIHNYTDYSTIILTESYLNNLNEIISVAKNTIKGIDSNTLITTNVGGYPYNEILHNQWKQFFDAIGQNLDVLTLDIYPDDNIEIINALENRVNDIKSRYGKPVYIGETGMCTSKFGESNQGYYVSMHIEQFKKSSPINIIVYEIQDDNSKTGCEATFGLKHVDGTPKASYSVILEKMA